MDRLTAEDALSHHFLRQYSCPEDEPTSLHPFRIEDELDESLFTGQDFSYASQWECDSQTTHWDRYVHHSWLSGMLVRLTLPCLRQFADVYIYNVIYLLRAAGPVM